MSIYRIQRVKQIGAGGFSVVYEAILPNLGRVALKELVSRLPDDVVRFRREVQYQLQLHHANIVPVLAYELDTNPLWFAMPLASSNLDREISRVQADRAWAHSIFRQIMAGVAHAHRYHVIHRDLKPENILLYDGDVVSITDFGLGKLLDTSATMLTQTGQAFGSLAYIAPEQLEDTKSADERADIYALGKLLYKMLTDDVHPLLEIDPNRVEPKYRDLLLKCTAAAPDDRYQTVDELCEAFEQIH
jgi:serine/threonine protein kinase